MSKSLRHFTQYVGKKIDEFGWPARELSRRSKVSATAVNMIISGKQDPRLSSIEAIAGALNVEPFYLLMSPDDRSLWDTVQKAKEGESILGLGTGKIDKLIELLGKSLEQDVKKK